MAGDSRHNPNVYPFGLEAVMGNDGEVLLHTGDMITKGAETQHAFRRFPRVALQCGEVTVAVVEV